MLPMRKNWDTRKSKKISLVSKSQTVVLWQNQNETFSLNCNERSVQNTLLSHLYAKKSYKYLSCLPKKFVLRVKKDKGFLTFKSLLIFKVLIVNLCPNVSSHCFIFFWNMSLSHWNTCRNLAIEGQAGFPSGSVVE